MKFARKLLRKEPKEKGKAPAMIVFHAEQQKEMLIETAKNEGFKHYTSLFFIKNQSPQALKANQRVVGAVEFATLFYRDKLPKFNNSGQMVFNWIPWSVDRSYPKIHETQKPIPVLQRLIELYTDTGDVVIDPCAGSGSTLRAAIEMNRHAYGFEVERKMCELAREKMLSHSEILLV